MTDDCADLAEVAAFVVGERQSRDRGWWERWAACFTVDATISMSWFSGSAAEFVKATRERSVGGVWGRHRLSPPAVRLHGDRAWAELPLAIEFHLDLDGVEVDLVSYCRSQYRARREDDGWRVAAITSIYERDTLTPSVPGTVLPVGPGAFAGRRVSYRCLAWYLEHSGETVSDDLLGDDRPSAVAEAYAAEQSWLQTVHSHKEN